MYLALLRNHHASDGVDSDAHHPLVSGTATETSLHTLDGVDSDAYYPLRHAPDEHCEYQVHSIVNSMKDGGFFTAYTGKAMMIDQNV
jgi:hypothetical protein